VTVERRMHECSHPAAHSASDPTARTRRIRRTALPVVVLGSEVGSGGDEQLDHVWVTEESRKHECSRPAARSASDPTVRSRSIRRTALPFVVLGREVGASDEQLDQVRVALDRRMHERREPIPSSAAARQMHSEAVAAGEDVHLNMAQPGTETAARTIERSVA
jgi:hypothetical protein